ncbi:MAG: hypothetical protein K6G31_02140 [Paludibacteraceae bacterium]|nr:hypothetical protein [Paludibacteraceae bacterium]
MGIFSKNKSMLGKNNMVEIAIELLKDLGNELIVKNDYAPLLNDFIKNMSGEIKGIAVGKEVEVLDMNTLVEFSKKYIVANCNEIVAINTMKDGESYVYLAYSKDRNLLPIENNKYLIIKAKSLSKEVESLFEESSLVILK